MYWRCVPNTQYGPRSVARVNTHTHARTRARTHAHARAIVSQMSVGSERDRLVTGPSATRRQAVAAAVAGLSSLTVGLSCGFSSPTIPQLEAEGLLTTAGEVSWFASILLVGALAGAGLGAVLVERLGRKGAVLSGGLPSAVGWCLLASGAGPARLLAGRVLAGLGVGVVSVSVPLYTAEIATPALRGRLASLHPIGIALGMMLSYGGSMLLPWRWLAVAGGAVTTAAVTLMAGVPESPTWLLASYDDDRQAALALRWLRGGLRADIEHEMYELHAVAAHSHRAATLRELVSERALYRPVLVGVAILTLQQFSGINAIMFYAQNIFRSAGFSSGSDAATPALVVAAIQVIVTAASSVFIDHVGRRPLLILGGFLFTYLFFHLCIYLFVY